MVSYECGRNEVMTMQLVCIAMSEHSAALLNEPGQFELCSRFAHVVNLCRDHTVISFQTPDIPRTPLSVVLDNASFQWLHGCSEQIRRAEAGDGTLAWNGTKLTTEKAFLYSSHLPAAQCRLDAVPYRRLSSFAAILAKPDSFVFLPHILPEHSQSCTEVQQYADKLLDISRIHELIGLGGGLTPAGDDFLVGTLAVLHWLERREAEARLTSEIARRLNKTTLISGAFLERALEGEFSQPVLAFFEAMENGSETMLALAVSKLCSVGHTSGSDLLGGVLWMLNQIIKQEGHM